MGGRCLKKFGSSVRNAAKLRSGDEKATVSVTALARVDLLQLWLYLAGGESLDVADKVLADIEEAIEQIVESPGIGHRPRI